MGISVTNQLINETSGLHYWVDTFKKVKKDDLADCFLQGLWFMKEKKFVD